MLDQRCGETQTTFTRVKVKALPLKAIETPKGHAINGSQIRSLDLYVSKLALHPPLWSRDRSYHHYRENRGPLYRDLSVTVLRPLALRRIEPQI